MQTRAIDPAVALAVAQQNLSLALVLGAEGVLNSQRMAPDFVGRPNLPALAPALGGCVAAFAGPRFLTTDDDLLFVHFRRARTTVFYDFADGAARAAPSEGKGQGPCPST